jgi:hypothetical protein
VTDLEKAIPQVRRSVVAILRLQLTRPLRIKKGREIPAQIGASIVGSGFCVVKNKYVITAFHIFNGGNAREPKDKFYAFTVPQNGDPAFHFPVIGFPLEDPTYDLAVLELGPCATVGVDLEAVPLTLDSVPDGAKVLTVGFPAPEISAANADPDLNWLGGQFFLKSHANEGIVSASYVIAGALVYELNVGWHHGESGGPIALVDEIPRVFSVMQNYRIVKSPHGVMAGPHRGVALSVARAELAALGIQP